MSNMNTEIRLEIEEKYKIKKDKNIQFKNYIENYVSQNRLKDIENCGSYLEFIADKTLTSKKLLKANFCKNRFCPFCAWRKSLKESLKNFILIKYLKNNFDYEFIFLTLTSPNVQGEELENEVKDFNESFKKLMKRKELLKINKGYIRKLEVTYDNNEYITENLYNRKKSYYKSKGLNIGDYNITYNTYNPHFHIIIAVSKSYFTSKNYVSKSKFLELWKECKKDNSITQIDIKKVGLDDKKAILEISKYVGKDSDYLTNKNVFDIFYKSLRGKQLITYNGVFKDVVKLYKKGDLDYLKEIDPIYYEFFLSYTFNFKKSKYDLFSLKELSIDQKFKYNINKEKENF